MSHEIYYTSAPEGVKRGSSGFSTVGVSEGIPKALWDRLESLSAYRHQFGGADANRNPVSWAHWMLNVAGANYHVLSRVCDSGVDHTQRTNAFAHHLVVERGEMGAAAGGPAWLMMQGGVMREAWDGNVGAIVRGGKLPGGDGSGGVCDAWKAVMGDAGWGGVLADAFVKSPAGGGKPVCILFAAGQDVLPLMAETIALLPAALRWSVTFNTYFTSMPTSATCAWRCCLAGSPAAASGLRYAGGASGGIVIDLTEPGRLGKPAEGAYVQYARTGQAPVAAAAAETVAAGKGPIVLKAGALAGPGKGAAGVGRPVRKPAIEEDDEDSVDLDPPAPLVMPGTEIVGADEEGEVEMAPVAEAPAKKRPLIRKRITKEMPPAYVGMGDFEGAGGGSARAAAKRRRQVGMLFGGAVFAIFAATVLVVVSMKAGSPPELPPIPRAKPPAEAVAASIPAPSIAVPEPPAAIVHTPAPLPETNNTVVLPAPTQTTETKATVSVPEVVSHYPAVVKASQGIDFPTVGHGFDTTFAQRIALPAGEIDPALEVQRVELQFPASKEDYPGVMTFGSAGASGAGSLVAGIRPTDRTVATVAWKVGSGDPAEVVAIDYSRQKNAVELTWRGGQLVKDRENVLRAFWVLSSSTLTLDSAGGGKAKSQTVAFAPYEPPAFSLETESGAVTLPVDLPKETTVKAPAEKDMGNGWEGTWFTEADTKAGGGDVILQNSDNAAQVVKFHQKTATPAAEPWFIVRFSDNYKKMENTFAVRAAAAQADLAQAESDVRAADEALDRIRKDAGGTLPASSENAKLYQGKRADAATLAAAYKSEVDGYNQLTQVDIDLTLPNGVRLTTIRFRRTGKQ